MMDAVNAVHPSTSAAAVTVRKAGVSDLPAIHQLIRESFAAMVEHSYLCGEAFWARMAQSMIDTELSEREFETIYFSNSNFFWVAESDGNVVGCVGVKHSNPPGPSAELVRMAVSPSCRSSGIGGVLIQSLIDYCSANESLSKIVLTTGNPRSVRFYEKHGFIRYNRVLFFYMERALR